MSLHTYSAWACGVMFGVTAILEWWPAVAVTLLLSAVTAWLWDWPKVRREPKFLNPDTWASTAASRTSMRQGLGDPDAPHQLTRAEVDRIKRAVRRLSDT